MGCACKNKQNMIEKYLGAVPQEETPILKIGRYIMKFVLAVAMFALMLIITPIILLGIIYTLVIKGKGVITLPDKYIKKLLQSQNGEKS